MPRLGGRPLILDAFFCWRRRARSSELWEVKGEAESEAKGEARVVTTCHLTIYHLPSKAIPSFCIHIFIHFVFILPNPESQNVRKYFQYIGAVT